MVIHKTKLITCVRFNYRNEVIMFYTLAKMILTEHALLIKLIYQNEDSVTVTQAKFLCLKSYIRKGMHSIVFSEILKNI